MIDLIYNNFSYLLRKFNKQLLENFFFLLFYDEYDLKAKEHLAKDNLQIIFFKLDLWSPCKAFSCEMSPCRFEYQNSFYLI